MKSVATDLEAKGNAEGARLLKAFAAEFDGKTAEAALKNMGLDVKTGSAIYGLGLSPVARVALADPAAWDAFVGRLETAYGKKLDTADAGGQAYRHVTLADSGVQLVIATVGKQAVVSLLPADAAQPLIRQALGVRSPGKEPPGRWPPRRSRQGQGLQGLRRRPGRRRPPSAAGGGGQGSAVLLVPEGPVRQDR